MILRTTVQVIYLSGYVHPWMRDAFKSTEPTERHIKIKNSQTCNNVSPKWLNTHVPQSYLR